MKSYLILIVLIVIVLQSCSQEKNEPINQLFELTEDIREHHNEYSTADWKEAYARYERIAAEMEKYQYTNDEAEKIGRLEGECVGYFMKSTVNSLDGWGREIKGFFDGLGKSMK